MAARRKIKPVGIVRINTYAILSRAIEQGIDWGYLHAHKNTDAPTEDALKEQLLNDIMNEVCEVVDFDFGESGE